MKGLKRIIVIAISLMLSVALFGCEEDPGIYINPQNLTMRIGNRTSVQVKSRKDGEMIYNVVYASSDSSVASVSKDGIITASGEGEATIYVQQIDKPYNRAETKVTVTVATQEPSSLVVNTEDTSVDGSSYGFWSRNGYEERVGNWDVIDIAKIVVEKGYGDYVFTDVYREYSVNNAVICTATDWSNEDTVFEQQLLTEFGIDSFLFENLNTEPFHLNQSGVDVAEARIREYVYEKQQALQNSMDFSTLPEDMEYRVVFLADYSVYRVENFYSNGKLKGIFSLIGDAIKGSISSFLDSYTYSKTDHEVVINSINFVIERRPKQ